MITMFFKERVTSTGMGVKGDAKKGGLEWVVKDLVQAQHHNTLEPRFYIVKRPTTKQFDLFDFHGNQLPSSNLGFFYELVGRAFYGGTLYGSRRSPLPGYPVFESNPDTVDLGEQKMREHKGCARHRTLILRDGQISRYIADQCNFPDWDIRSTLFRHSFRDIRSFKGTEGKLYGSLAQGTVYALDLPLAVLIELHNGETHNNGHLVATRSSNGSFPESTRVSKGFMNYLFINPVAALQNLGLNPDEYIATRLMSPPDVKIAGRTLKPFPILRLEHGDPASWRARLIESPPQIISSSYRAPPSYVEPLFDLSLISGQGEIDGCSDVPDECVDSSVSKGREIIPF